jgi:hypothetical protein
MSGLVESVKKAAVGAVEASKPSGVFFGVVQSNPPLKILVEQHLLLNKAQLALARSVTDHEIEISVDHQTEIGNDHRHDYKGKKTFLLHLDLKPGEKVVLLRVQGGQKYVVLDRVAE